MAQRILVVEDDDHVLRSVAKILYRAGYDVLTAVDVASARRHAESGPIAAAIVDYALSRETGLDVLSHLREVQPDCIRILLTGLSEDSVFVDSINRGEVMKVIKKPFDPAELKAKLEEGFAQFKQTQTRLSEKQNQEREREIKMLDEALRGPIRLALQPIFAVDGEQTNVFAYEALLRPRHEQLNNPLKLLGLAEKHDRIPDVGTLVFELAREVLDWIGPEHQLFVNLHPHQLGHPERLARELAQFAGHTEQVVIEITEQSEMQEIGKWEESIRQILDSGCRIAVDDLGAGYSSLRVLADLQPAFIKLDMTLVRNVHLEPRKQRLVNLLQKFGEATDACVIAEGVESADEQAALLACGIRMLQGYHLARPSDPFAETATATAARDQSGALAIPMAMARRPEGA